ncbi:MBL fold metallo-hydrolase [Candidatus Acetothermia bacterium]|nr:MBL fold metallo-hydrolase [Candidatus Acetothermia bacterium]MBI3461329.1 MBL fold metallo-hydrolase [Candidatus Acetothermia bacterium]MBI3659678.1 MBL fold metallo-hydrolase [Candidatus Acetothermia bacterium]
MLMEILPLGELQANCYILKWEKTQQAIVIDPGAPEPQLLDRIGAFQVTKIINTHGHWDHVLADQLMKETYGAKILIHRAEHTCFKRATHSQVEVDEYLEEGNIIQVGEIHLRVLHTPGHTPGSIVLMEEERRWLFTGDLLLKDGTGGANVPGGSYPDFVKSIQRLRGLKKDYHIYPGHGPSTTLTQERESNPYLKYRLTLTRPVEFQEDRGAI